MATPKAHLYTIPAHLPFARRLAQGLLDQYGHDMTALSEIEILMPNRRSCRTLHEAFLAIRDGAPCLLPRLSPIGDVDEDDVMLADIFDDGFRDIPPAIPPLERQMLLMQLIAKQRPDVPPAQLFNLSVQLAQLIDHVHTEGIDWATLGDLVPSDLAQHWQITVEFLGILFDYWPAILNERGLIDGADRRNRLLRAKAQSLRNGKSKHPVIAAGSTGSIPATRDLLKTIAYLPNGQVVLSGLDHAMPETEWDEIDNTHAQFYLKHLLDHIGVSRPQVKSWPGLKELEAAQLKAPPRTVFLQHCVATTTASSPKRLDKEALNGLEQAMGAQAQQEARIVALHVREAMEKPDQNVLVVTPDRTLAQRITAELGRWDIAVNDAAGQPLSDTRIGTWLQVTAALASPNSQALCLLAMLHHPFAGLGYAHGDYRHAATLFEKYILRGPPWRGGVPNIITITQERLPQSHARNHPVLTGFAARLHDILQDMSLVPQRRLQDWLSLHLSIAEQLAATEQQPGAARLWAGEDGEMAADVLRDLMAQAHQHPPLMDALDYADFISAYLMRQTFRPRYPLHPRIHILSPVEARFQTASLVILAGLNEGLWPRETPYDPFMSQPMRQSFGLPPFSRRIGQAALDFYLLSHAQNVLLTHSATQDGAAIAPSRWLQHMQIVLQQHDLPRLDQSSGWADLAQRLDYPERVTPQERPRFAPPLSARPRRLSISDLDLWRRDPYGLYARKILRLRKLEPPENEAAARDWGNIVHHLLEEFGAKRPFPFADWLRKAQSLIERASLPADIAVQWRQRLDNIGRWLEGQPVASDRTYTEIDGTYKFPDLDFTVTGRADRIDVTGDNAVIIDYKTGQSPSWPQVKSGYAPQLPFLGLMLQQQSFASIAATTIDGFEYWSPKGTLPKPVEIAQKTDDISDILERNRALYARMIGMFDQADTPYITRPHPKHVNRYNDYDHLERVQEWASSEDDGA